MEKNPQREQQLQEYYKSVKRKDDPVWTAVKSERFQILDYVDIFKTKGKNRSTMLAYYSSIKNLTVPPDSPPCKYPFWNYPMSAAFYYGMLLNIFAYLTESPSPSLLLVYDNNKTHPFRYNPIMPELLLEHWENQYLNKDKSQMKIFAPLYNP